MTLLHLLTPAEWSAGVVDPGPDGFVHLSRPDQVHIPAGLLYAGRDDLVALVVEEDRLGPEVRVEGGFPHLYGPLTRDAVVDVVPFDHDLLFVPTPPTEDPAAGFLAAMEGELASMYGRPPETLARDRLLAPDGAYAVGWERGRPVAGGGFTRYDATTAEIRRMYVVPDARSRGVARRLLAAVEGMARRRGYRAAILDTGARQPHAEALYRSAGYVDVEPFNDSPAVFFGRRSLEG
ncbi:MAG: GNAT family N-acetyltransferase [Acidimicrobiia bacterium]